MPTKKKTLSKKAWVVSVDMGYGHQRAAYPLKDIAYERVFTANSGKIISKKEKKLWKQSRSFYEAVSRMTGIPIVGKHIFNLYDRMQSISSFYPFRDLSKPSWPVIYMDKIIQKGLCRSVINYVSKKELPFITTIFIPAFAAEYGKLKNIYCVVTDVDINRSWVPINPQKTKIIYLAPAPHTAKRLLQYGVPKKQIIITGFPLPKENLGGEKLPILKKDLSKRLLNLDPNKKYINRFEEHIKKNLGIKKLPTRRTRPLTIMYAIGGAGAQKEIGVQIMKSLKKQIQKNKIAIYISAGMRLELVDYFKKAVYELGLSTHLNKTIKIIFGINKPSYFSNFNEHLHTTDILWTKPSELSFYTALGLPIIIAPPIGAHEHYNKKWLIGLGGGIEQENPEYVNEWLFDWLADGRLAEAAWEGFTEAENKGTYNIEKLLFQKS
ncbi:MAG: DUF6938 domain-containing protein [Alphaproteobacteria bacterium]